MLERHRDQAGKIGSAPRPIELEPWLPRRAREPRGPLLGRLGARVGREPERWIEGEVPLLVRSEEHTSELQSRLHLVCRLLLEKKNIMQAVRIARHDRA